MIPNKISHYQILEQLGSGGMGAVYRARDLKLKRDVALKVIHKKLLDDPYIVHRFRQEIEILKNLEHSAIVPVYDFGLPNRNKTDESQHLPFMVMRYMSGGTLQERLDRRPLFPDEAMQIFLRVASALGAMHEQGLVHRDLKPQNIFFDKYGEAYLGDFGLAKSVDSDQSKTAAVGTFAYMSPEQLTGQTVTSQSDIYALGGLLYAMLTGKRPYYQHNTPSAIMEAHRFAPPPDLQPLAPQLSRQINHVIQRAMAKDPSQRFATAQEMSAELVKSLQNPSDITEIQNIVTGDTVLEADQPPARVFSSAQLVMGGGFIILALLLGGIGLWRFVNNPTSPFMLALIPTATHTPTQTIMPTDIPTATNTFTSTPTLTNTPTPTDTPTPTPTTTYTITPTPTNTHTPTSSPTPTDTPTPTLIPTLLVEGFENYVDGTLQSTFEINRNAGNDGSLALAGVPHVYEGLQAVAFTYDIDNSPPNDYIGFEREFPTQDWSTFTLFCLWIEVDGSNRNFVMQFGESKGKIWKQLNSLAIIGTGEYCIPLDQSGLNLSAIAYYGIYVSGPPEGEGLIYIDNIHLKAE